MYNHYHSSSSSSYYYYHFYTTHFTIYIVNLSAGPVLRCNLEAVNRHSSNCHGLGLSWLVLGEFGAIPTLALLHDGLCTFDLSWISTVPRTDGTRTHSASRFHGARETSRKKIDKFTSRMKLLRLMTYELLTLVRSK